MFYVSKFLNKKMSKLRKLKTVAAKNLNLPDIEEVPGGTTKSPYFSPIQTRKHRLLFSNPLKTTYELPPSKINSQTNFIVTKSDDTIENNANKESDNVVNMTSKLDQKKKTTKKPLNNPIVPKEKESTNEIKMESGTNKTGERANKMQAIQMPFEPTNWQQCLENIRKMRSQVLAPVDTMGCESCADENVNEKTQRFHKLVALMLSSQTKDATTFEAMKKLKAQQLTPESIVAMEVAKLESLLNPVSFYKNKAKYLQQTSHILINKYDSDIPNNVKELIELPGVGPKMAHICMSTAWNECTGIGVDVHVHRISNRLKWVPKETKEPEQTRLALEAWLPRDLWSDVNHLLVGFGQTICTPLRPNCGDCLNRNICPFAAANKDAKPKKQTVITDDNEIPLIKKSKVHKKKV